jgi:diguanylate cyclase (GGDEF)-like protein/PAS domain S-box-containing protein
VITAIHLADIRMQTSGQNSTQVAADAASGESFHAVLSEIGQLLVRSPEPAVLYEAVIEVLQRRIGARLVTVGELDRRSGWLQRIAPARVTAEMADIYPERIPFSAAQPAFWRGEPQLEADVRGNEALRIFWPAYIRHDVHAALAVPVLKFGEVCAALTIRATHVDFFSPRMIELLQQTAISIGFGLEAHEQRARLLLSVRDEARQRRALRLLSEMIKLVTHSDDEQALLTGACHVVRTIGGYRAAAIGLLDAGSPGRVQQRAHDGMDGLALLDIEPGQIHHTPAAAMVVSALATGMPRSSHSAAAIHVDPLAASDSAEGQSLLALPLRVDGAIAGCLLVCSPSTDAFGEIEIQAFAEMAVELGLGIQMQRAHAARLAAEQELRFNLQYFRTVLANQHAGILVMSEDDCVEFANDAFCAMFGLTESPDELKGKPTAWLDTHLRPAYGDPEAWELRTRQILQQNLPVKGDEVTTSDGRILLRDFMPVRIGDVPSGRLWHHRDISQQKMHEARVERLAFYDVVTGLPNRRLFFELLGQACPQAKAQGTLLAVGVLDLDRFKSVNDTIGHGGGDHVLAEASSRIVGMLREADVLARFGGDEFALLIPGLDSREQLDVISRCILQVLRVPFNLMGEQLYLSASIGWTLFPLDDADAEGLVRHADLAMYQAKDEGKDRGLLYEPAMELEQVRLQAMRERIAQALHQGQLQLLFQPIVYIDGLPGLNGVAGMEALMRLCDSDEMVEPGKFMHVLDDPQLARPIGRYVLDEALRCCQSWIRAGASIPVSVNISTRHLLHPAFFTDIDAVLETYPDVMDVGFGIEVTETGPTMDHARAKEVIEECRRRGIRVGLDDFGTGSASLSHIQKLDIEHIKLDQSFVRDIISNDRNMAIAAGVITTARMLAKVVIAEGVETAEQGDLLASLGCHQLQGFWISRPMRPERVPDWVAGWVPPASWSNLVDERQLLLEGQQGAA